MSTAAARTLPGLVEADPAAVALADAVIDDLALPADGIAVNDPATGEVVGHLVRVAGQGVTAAAQTDPALRLGLSTLGGKLVSKPVAEACELPFTDPAELLDAR